MEEKKTYKIVPSGKKAERRNYSKVSGSLELPNLVEIQTDSFEWFIKTGIREVFEEIYPISNFGGNIKLYFKDYEFEKPKYTAEESQYRECNFAAPLKATMELEIVDSNTGEVLTKQEEVFLGDFPLMTETGTFIINGAERVIVSQIVRSPGAYFDSGFEEKTGKETYSCELIPSRGTWLEFFTETKKSANGRALTVSVDRKRKIMSTVLFKAIGMALDMDRSDDPMDTKQITTFLNALGRNTNFDKPEIDENREYLDIYLTLYGAYFGKYEDIENTLVNDKVKTTQEALLSIYENQRPDENPILDGSINLMNAKFFDRRRYDLTKAGRYKLGKKLNAINRIEHHVLAHDIIGADGKVFMKKGTLINRDEREILKPELKKGIYVKAFPFNPLFVHDDVVAVETSCKRGLLGRILAKDVECADVTFYEGDIITDSVLSVLEKECEKVSIYAGVIAQPVKLTPENVSAVLNYGHRLYELGCITDEKGNVVPANDGGSYTEGFMPRVKTNALSSDLYEELVNRVHNKENLVAWLVGAAVQEVMILDSEGHEIKVTGNDPFANKHTITISDMYAFYAYMLNVMEGVGETDDIDMLGNRRIRTVGELIQNQFTH